MRFSCVSPFSDAFLMRLRPDPTVSHAHHFFPVHFSCVFCFSHAFFMRTCSDRNISHAHRISPLRFSCVFCFSRAFFMRPYFIRTYLMRFAAISYSFHAHSDFLMRISCVSVPLHAFSMHLIPHPDSFLMRFVPFFCVSHTLPVRFLCGHYIPKGWQDTRRSPPTFPSASPTPAGYPSRQKQRQEETAKEGPSELPGAQGSGK